MVVTGIRYRINTAGTGDIAGHLLKCKDNFIPALDKTVDIQSYAKKIGENSVTFEAWNEQELAGLIAAYFNDPQNHTGFITSVSTLAGFTGKGVASRLLENCIAYGREKKFREIVLEVHRDNRQAIRLYEKYGFKPTKDKEQLEVLTLYL